MTGVLRVEVIRGAAALSGLESAWWGLWGRCPEATPFQCPAWLLAWWQAFRPGDLATVAVWAGTDLVGLAPLYLEAGSARLLPIGIGITDYMDILLDPAGAAKVARAIGAALAELPGWTSLCLEELAAAAAALRLPPMPGWTESDRAQSVCPVLSFDGRADLAGVIPARKLRKLRMARNRVARRGGTIEQADAGSAPSHLEALFRLHAARWEERGERGVLADEAVQRFHAAALPGLVGHGLLRSYLLRIEGRVAGIFYGFQAGGALLAYLGGFDPGFAFESPGTVLMGHAIEQAMREGARELHLLRGQEAYKYDWGAADRWTTCRTFCRDL